MKIGDILRHKTGNYTYEITAFDGLDVICLKLSDNSHKRICKKDINEKYEFIKNTKGGNNMKLTSLQQTFIDNLPKGNSINVKNFLEILDASGIMNKMQAGACITTLRKKGYIDYDPIDKSFKLIEVTEVTETTEAPKTKRRGRPKKTA